MKTSSILLIFVTVLLLITAIFFFKENQSLISEKQDLQEKLIATEQNLLAVKEEKTQVEKELIYLKHADLPKEIEILKLKLKESESDLTAVKKNLSAREADLEKLRIRMNKILEIVDVLSMIEAAVHAPPPTCFNPTDIAEIRKKISMSDKEWLSLWDEFMLNVEREICSYAPHLLLRVLNKGFEKISSLAKF